MMLLFLEILLTGSHKLSGEVITIRNMAPINLIVYSPETEEGQTELAKQIANLHAAAVTQHIKLLNCPTNQKLALLEAVLNTVKERSREQTF